MYQKGSFLEQGSSVLARPTIPIVRKNQKRYRHRYNGALIDKRTSSFITMKEEGV